MWYSFTDAHYCAVIISRFFGVYVSNIATKSSSHDDGLVDRLSISTNMQNKPDLSASTSCTIACHKPGVIFDQCIFVKGNCCHIYTIWKLFVP